MSTHISWFNFENSLNPFEPQEESSRVMFKDKENSVSFLGRFPSLQRQQQSRSVLNIQAIFESFLHQDESLLCKLHREVDQMPPESSNDSSQSQISQESESEIQQSSSENLQPQAKKGLKHLAKLLARTLKKKKFESSKQLAQEIQQVLINRKKLSKNEYARQSKNIRRRTYDAINVMIAANVIDDEFAFLRKVGSTILKKRKAISIGSKTQLESKIPILSQNLQKKRFLLKQLKNKRKALQWWFNNKKSESLKQQPKQQEFQRSFRKTKIQKKSIKPKTISFPIVFIQEQHEQCQENIEIKGQSLVFLKSKNPVIKLFSEIDVFQILKSQQQSKTHKKETEAEQQYLDSCIKLEEKQPNYQYFVQQDEKVNQ